MRPFIFPGSDGSLQAFFGQGIVEAPEHPACRGQGRGRSVFHSGVAIGEGIAVVAAPRAVALDLVDAERGIVDAVVSDNGRLAEGPVLLQARVRDPGEAVAGDAIPGQEVFDAVRDLLEDIGLSVRDVQDDVPAGGVDRRLVGIEAEGFAAQGEQLRSPGLGASGEIVVGRVVPAAPVETGNVLVGGVFRLRRRALPVPLDERQVDIRRGLEDVVQMAGAMPDAAAVDHADMAHLHGQEGLEGRLPDVMAIDRRRDKEGRRAGVAEADHVSAGLLDLREVEEGVFVPEEPTPSGHGFREHGNRALFGSPA